jgi:multicomponent Na+:H+ antiporter subunit B
MTSLILQTAARLLEPIMLLVALFLLLSGHNKPGGGFAGGLTAATAFVLHVIAFDLRSARRMLVVSPQALIGVGLLLGMGSGLPALLAGDPYMDARWTSLHIPDLGVIKLGTPLLFDIGVFLVVVGVVSLIVSVLTEMQERAEKVESSPDQPPAPSGDMREEESP